MKLIVGLGNPGLAYVNTRHNLGARAVKTIAKEYRAKFRLDRSLKSRVARVSIDDNECLLAIPNTFMNISGRAISLLLNTNEIPPKDLLVVHDDMDLELGVAKFRKKGSSGGHKGIDSIIDTINTQEFNRLKLGIGRSSSKEKTIDYVLSNFRRQEIKIINTLLEKVVKISEAWVKFGPDKAMNQFNQ